MEVFGAWVPFGMQQGLAVQPAPLCLPAAHSQQQHCREGCPDSRYCRAKGITSSQHHFFLTVFPLPPAAVPAAPIRVPAGMGLLGALRDAEDFDALRC